MEPCKRIGIEITKRCNNRCKMCFHYHAEDFNTKYDKPLDEVKAEIIEGKKGGCDQVVVVGWGESMLYSQINELADYVRSENMKFSIITNGNINVSRYEELYLHGLDHLHISLHGIGETLNNIAGSKTNFEKQDALIRYLDKNVLPWRSNTTIQLDNYKELPNLIDYASLFGCEHFVLLNFLPHYGWRDKVKDIAVHPKLLKPYVEEAIDIALENNVMTTLRYFPMCHLDPKYWKYVVNAFYVVYDPFEWCYGGVWPNAKKWDMIRNAKSINDVTRIKEEPCANCKLLGHCAGWNRFYAEAFDGADLKAITEVPDEYKDIVGTLGSLHDLNPANNHRGWFL